MADVNPAEVLAPADKVAAPVKVEPVSQPVAAPVAAKAKAVRKQAKAPAAPVAPKAAKKVAKPAKAAAKDPSAKKAVKPAAKPTTKSVATPVSKLKDTIMTTAKTKTKDFKSTVKDAFADVQAKTKAAYGKGAAAVAEANEFAKGNAEAVVASGKILAEGVKTLGEGYVAEGKKAYETFTADAKEMAAIKSPTDFFEFQSKILRRNFDSMVALTSKNTEATVKLVNDAFAPISSRVSLVVEKVKKAA